MQHRFCLFWHVSSRSRENDVRIVNELEYKLRLTFFPAYPWKSSWSSTPTNSSSPDSLLERSPSSKSGFGFAQPPAPIPCPKWAHNSFILPLGKIHEAYPVLKLDSQSRHPAQYSIWGWHLKQRKSCKAESKVFYPPFHQTSSLSGASIVFHCLRNTQFILILYFVNPRSIQPTPHQGPGKIGKLFSQIFACALDCTSSPLQRTSGAYVVLPAEAWMLVPGTFCSMPTLSMPFSLEVLLAPAPKALTRRSSLPIHQTYCICVDQKCSFTVQSQTHDVTLMQ